MRRVNGHSTKTFCQNIKAAATVRKVDQWIWPSRKKQSTAVHVQVLQLVVEGKVEREVETVVLFVLGYRKRISVWFSSQLNRAWQQQQKQQRVEQLLLSVRAMSRSLPGLCELHMQRTDCIVRATQLEGICCTQVGFSPG